MFSFFLLCNNKNKMIHDDAYASCSILWRYGTKIFAKEYTNMFTIRLNQNLTEFVRFSLKSHSYFRKCTFFGNLCKSFLLKNFVTCTYKNFSYIC